MALRIEDYALIGDRRGAALVGNDGSIDWLCLPRFDSPACLAALLGTEEHGCWRIEPVGDYTVERSYVGDTTVLETTFRTEDGEATLTDLMPRLEGRADVVRVLWGVRGTVRFTHTWRVRMDYGSVRPWVRRDEVDGEPVITAVAGPDTLVLRGPELPVAVDHTHEGEVEVSEGEEKRFSMSWLPSHRPIEGLAAHDDVINRSVEQDEDWADTCRDDLPHLDLVKRSLLTLRLMTHEETGGIVAAPTTSLPESFGGSRNWDYRYCWLRDAALTLSALLTAGFTEEAMLWRDWLLRAVAGDPEDLQVMYAVDGARRLPEEELAHLPGYAGSRPVRIGNGAVDQRQHDVLGEVMAALQHVREAGDDPDGLAWSLQRALVGELAEHWQDPDRGMWEIRGEPQHFVHSKVMVWVAFDRAVRAVEEHGLEGDVERWREIRDEVHAEVLAKGWDEDRGTFVQHYGTRAVEEDLLRDGLVLRYDTDTGVDGLDCDENPFLACSFWLVSAYAGAGRLEDAHALFDRLVGLVNDVGLLAEEYDPVQGRMAGNFPQAFSHLALVQAAFDLADAG